MVTLNQNFAAPAFTGEFRHKIEGKNRVTIPSAWRFAEDVELFMIPRSIQTSIGVMTRAEVERIKADVTTKLDPIPRAKFLETFGRELRQVTLDKAGRITIPDELCTSFRLAKEVWLTGAVETFNIWNVADFEADRARQRAAAADVMSQLGI